MASPIVTDAFGQVFEPFVNGLSLDGARVLADYQLPRSVQARLEELAEKSTEGTLSPAEREDYLAFVTALDVVALLQAKARRRLSPPQSA